MAKHLPVKYVTRSSLSESLVHICRAADGINRKTDMIRHRLGLPVTRIGALRIAARFFDRSKDTIMFKRGMDAFNHAEFYRQFGKDPDQIIAAALTTLAMRLDLNTPNSGQRAPI